jgi:hypothetical protein
VSMFASSMTDRFLSADIAGRRRNEQDAAFREGSSAKG